MRHFETALCVLAVVGSTPAAAKFDVVELTEDAKVIAAYVNAMNRLRGELEGGCDIFFPDPPPSEASITREYEGFYRDKQDARVVRAMVATLRIPDAQNKNQYKQLNERAAQMLDGAGFQQNCIGGVQRALQIASSAKIKFNLLGRRRSR